MRNLLNTIPGRIVLCLYSVENKELVKITDNLGSFKLMYYKADGTTYFGYINNVEYTIRITEVYDYHEDYSTIFNKIKERCIYLDTKRKSDLD